MEIKYLKDLPCILPHPPSSGQGSQALFTPAWPPPCENLPDHELFYEWLIAVHQGWDEHHRTDSSQEFSAGVQAKSTGRRFLCTQTTPPAPNVCAEANVC